MCTEDKLAFFKTLHGLCQYSLYKLFDYIMLCNSKCVHVYQDFHLNRVSLEESVGSEVSPAGARPKKKNKKSYDLTAADKFWQKHKGR